LKFEILNFPFFQESLIFIEFISNYLGIKKKFLLASSLDVFGNSTDLLIDIIKKVGGDIYLSGSGGIKYQDEEKFSQNNIKLVYSDFKHPVYSQLWGEFIEGLSIIDLLFNCGKDSILYLDLKV